MGKKLMSKKLIYLVVLCLLAVMLPAQAFGFAGEVTVGPGSYSTVLPPGATNVQGTIYKTANVTGKMPTNDWWSNLAWDQYSEAQYPHPLALKPQNNGMRIYYPGNRITANSSCICGWINDIHDFTVGHTAVGTFPDAKVDGFSDWFVKALYQSGSNSMSVTYGHGSPYVYFNFTGGNPKLSFYTAPTVWSGNASSSVLGITMEGAHYGLYGANGSTWSGIGSTTLTNNGSSYFTVAVLPDNSTATLNKFAQYAYSHVTGSTANYSYNAATSEVTTTFTVTTQAKQGTQTGTIFALYPHQWKNSSNPTMSYTYNSVRGLMKTVEGSSFQTKMKFTGVLPSLPDKGTYNKATLQQYIDQAEAEVFDGMPDTYWVGKRLGKLAMLAPIADQLGDTTAANKFRNEIKSRLEDWFKASDSNGNLNSTALFYYNNTWGTLIGYPASFGSDDQLNDHHFHYGYFIKAAAEIARVDKAWANTWAPMVNLLIRDFASWDRNDTMFPYLRNFDPYAGHTWASGHARFGDGNNNESSSEAMNAWTGLILWGQATGNTTVRDLGAYLYTTEMNAINEYWFDVTGANHHPNFTRSTASMIWGGKAVGDGVWWSANPEEVHGINWLPFTGGSLYLTHYPAYANYNYTTLVSENGGTNFSPWEDLMYMYRAISNPTEAKNFWNSRGAALTAEAGNSKALAYHWIYNLDGMGNADPTITANYPLAAVFNKNGVKTYVAYNISNSPITVTFSDGQSVSVPANSFNTGNGSGGGGGGDNPVIGNGTGLKGEYFDNRDLTASKVVRTDATVDFNWGNGSPDASVAADTFSARWTGQVQAKYTGAHTFYTTTDDGVRLWVNNQLLIDKWVDQGATEWSGTINLTAGQKYDIKMEYYENGGGASSKLSWSHASLAKEVIPQTQLYPAATGGSGGVVSGKTYKLINVNSGKALDVNGQGTANGTNVQIWDDYNNEAQKWLITQNADGTFKLINPNSGKALDVAGQGTADGTNVQIWDDYNNAAQKWQITQNADGSYKLINPNSGKALDVSGSGTTNGTNVQIWTDNNTGAQKWNIVEVAPSNTGGGGGGGSTGSGPFTHADYTAGTTKPSASQARIYFTPNGYSAAYVDVHYLLNNGAQQNFRMTNNNGTWEQLVSGLSAGNTIEYWFTYNKNNVQYDSVHYTHTQ